MKSTSTTFIYSVCCKYPALFLSKSVIPGRPTSDCGRVSYSFICIPIISSPHSRMESYSNSELRLSTLILWFLPVLIWPLPSTEVVLRLCPSTEALIIITTNLYLIIKALRFLPPRFLSVLALVVCCFVSFYLVNPSFVPQEYVTPTGRGLPFGAIPPNRCACKRAQLDRN